jgi:hypothetical protein
MSHKLEHEKTLTSKWSLTHIINTAPKFAKECVSVESSGLDSLEPWDAFLRISDEGGGTLHVQAPCRLSGNNSLTTELSVQVHHKPTLSYRSFWKWWWSGLAVPDKGSHPEMILLPTTCGIRRKQHRGNQSDRRKRTRVSIEAPRLSLVDSWGTRCTESWRNWSPN